MPTDVDLGNRLRLLREAHGLTQRELGARAGIEHVTITRIERGQREPREDTLRFLAEALGTHPGALLRDEEFAVEFLHVVGIPIDSVAREASRRAAPSAPVLSDAQIEIERALAAQRARRQADALPVAQGSDDEPITRGELRRILEQLGRSGESPGEKPEPSRSDHAADEGGKNGSRGGRR